MEAGTPVRRKPITSIERTRKLSILLRHHRHVAVRIYFNSISNILSRLALECKIDFVFGYCTLREFNFKYLND